MTLYLICTDIGEYAAEKNGRARATDDANLAKRFLTEEGAVLWAERHLWDRRFRVHECLPPVPATPRMDTNQ